MRGALNQHNSLKRLPQVSARIQDDVVQLAAMKHRQVWKMSSDVSDQTKSAQLVCRSWQQAVEDNFQKRFRTEYPVGDGFNEKIDLVDLQDAVAYELKVSKNNTHFEFYRDIFKVAVHNAHNARWQIRKLVFITPTVGAHKLRTATAMPFVHSPENIIWLKSKSAEFSQRGIALTGLRNEQLRRK